MRRLTLALAVGVGAGGACDDADGDPYDLDPFSSVAVPSDDEIGAAPVRSPDDGFVYAEEVVVVDATPPTRFASRQPVGAELTTAENDYAGVPTTYPWARLCAGDTAMRDAVLAGLTRAFDRGTLDDALAEHYYAVLRDCASPTHCAWLADVAVSDRPLQVRWIPMRLLEGCSGERVRDALRARDASGDAVINWHRDHGPTSGATVPDEVARALPRLDPGTYVSAAAVLARYAGPGAATLLTDLQQMEDAVVRSTPDRYESRPLLEYACGVLIEAPHCPPHQGPNADFFINGSPLQYAQGLANPKRAAKADAVLTGCVQNETFGEAVQAQCLTRLALRDWASAKAIAKHLYALSATLRETVAILRRFESHAAFRARLTELGLLTERSSGAPQERLSAAEEMSRAGRVRLFEPLAPSIPVRHDRLLFDLSELAGDALADVVFEELEPYDLDGYADYDPYVVRAFADGKRWAVEAAQEDDAYNLTQAVGLLNVVLAERGSALRYLAVRYDQWTAWAVGPKDGLQTALDEGLLFRSED